MTMVPIFALSKMSSPQFYTPSASASGGGKQDLLFVITDEKGGVSVCFVKVSKITSGDYDEIASYIKGKTSISAVRSGMGFKDESGLPLPNVLHFIIRGDSGTCNPNTISYLASETAYIPVKITSDETVETYSQAGFISEMMSRQTSPEIKYLVNARIAIGEEIQKLRLANQDLRLARTLPPYLGFQPRVLEKESESKQLQIYTRHVRNLLQHYRGLYEEAQDNGRNVVAFLTPDQLDAKFQTSDE